jgi:hypothetical protein
MAQIILEDLPYEQRIAYLKNRAEKARIYEGLRKFNEEGEIFLYKLTVEGSGKVHTVKSDFKITSLNELRYIEYNKESNYHRFRLKELSYNLDKYEDPIVVQIVEMSNMISEIYQELDFWVDRFGALKKINNREQIRHKWEKVKEYLTYKHPLSSYEIIRAKENEMADPAMEIRNIRFIHFIQMYFMLFGRFEKQGQFEFPDMDRFGSLVPFNVNVNYTSKDEENGKLHRHLQGQLIHNSKVTNALCKAVKDSNAEVVYETKGDYHSEGMIIEEANFSYNEKIGEGYTMYSHLNLKLIPENGK